MSEQVEAPTHPMRSAKQPVPLEVPLPLKLLLDYDLEDQNDNITPVGSGDVVGEMCFNGHGSDVQVAVAPIMTTPGLEHSRSQDPHSIEHLLASQVVSSAAPIKETGESEAAARVYGFSLIPQHGMNAFAWLGMDTSAGQQQAASQICCEIAANNGNALLACNQRQETQLMEASMVMPTTGWGGMQSPAWQEHGYPDWHEQTLSKACAEAFLEARARNVTFLQNMTSEHARRLLLLRKISNFGLESEYFVRQHFEQYGVVEDVFICHNPKGYHRITGIRRFRPASRGLVLMSTAEKATDILNMGCEQVIAGRRIIVERFEINISIVPR